MPVLFLVLPLNTTVLKFIVATSFDKSLGLGKAKFFYVLFAFVFFVFGWFPHFDILREIIRSGGSLGTRV